MESNPVVDFIMKEYIITNDDKDKVQSSVIYKEFKENMYSELKMSTGKFKEKMLNMTGIGYKKSSQRYFTGLKKK